MRTPMSLVAPAIFHLDDLRRHEDDLMPDQLRHALQQGMGNMRSCKNSLWTTYLMGEVEVEHLLRGVYKGPPFRVKICK